MLQDDVRFAFGANWQRFLDQALTDQRIEAAVESLQRLLRMDTLQGRTFLDVGCGSGLFSLAACLLGAERVVAFDFDPDSVRASLMLRERATISPEKWQITQGSILDDAFLATLEPADVVYAWGVLHHTGALWRALDKAVGKVRPGGLLAISVYNQVDRRLGGSAMWWHIKRSYNRSPRAVQRLMESAYLADLLVRQVLTLRNPLQTIRQSGRGTGRGMEFWVGLRDWLGGFPYEYAPAGAVFTYLHDTFGLHLESLHTYDGHSCNEFAFRRPLASLP